MGTQVPNWILDIAKKLDTPEMRKLYREQKLANKDLDKSVEDFTEEIQDSFNHLRTPNGKKK